MNAGTGTVVNLTRGPPALPRGRDLTAALSAATDAESGAILAMAGDCARAASAWGRRGDTGGRGGRWTRPGCGRYLSR